MKIENSTELSFDVERVYVRFLLEFKMLIIWIFKLDSHSKPTEIELNFEFFCCSNKKKCCRSNVKHSWIHKEEYLFDDFND